MANVEPTLLVMAAGMGSRYGGLKQLDEIGPSGEAIIDYSIYDAIRAGFTKVIFVVGQQFKNKFKELFEPKLNGKIKTTYICQELKMLPDGFDLPFDRKKPWGTTQAVLVAEQAIDEPFAVINADDFYGAYSFKLLADFLKAEYRKSDGEFCLIGYRLGSTLSEFGSVSRGVCEVDSYGMLKSLTERTKIERREKGIVSIEKDGSEKLLTGKEPVSMNMWGFRPSVFKHLERQFVDFLKMQLGNPDAECYVPQLIDNLVQSHQTMVAVIDSPEEWFGMTYQDDKSIAIAKVRDLVDKGRYPEKLWA